MCSLQRNDWLWCSRLCLVAGPLVVALLSQVPPTYGDIFQLKTGGQITGTLADRGKQGEYIIQSDQGALVTLSRRQVTKVVGQDKIDLEYAQRSRTLPDSAAAHRELAQWCQENRRTKLSKHHWQRVVELDPTDEAARLSLGYQRHQGRWMTQDEIMAARGLIKYDNRYRTPQDIALREQEKKQKQLQVDWFQKIRLWVDWLDSRRAAEAAQKIAAVRDPNAASAFVKLLEKSKSQNVRDLLTATLAEIKHPLAVTTLVDFSLNEPDPEVRLQCLEYLIQHHQPLSLQPYFSALNDRKYNNEIINRAAFALHRIRDPRAISPLIDALVTTHQFKISDAPPGNTSASFSPSGGGGGFSAGNKPKFYKRDIPNLPVRQALVELSGGQDYEFNETLWRRWFVNQQKAKYVDARRDL